MAQNQQTFVHAPDIFKELAVVMAKHGYRPTEEEAETVLKIRRVTEISKIRAGLMGGALTYGLSGLTRLRHHSGGQVMLSLVSAAASAGIAGRWANNHCLQMLMQQPGPMGGEVCELIRQRDPEYPLLRNAPARMEGDPSARITPWSSEGEGESHDKAAMHNSNPAINVPSRDSNSLASAAGKDGMQESSQASADWGDAGDFSLGPLDTLAFAASEQSQEAQQQDQQHHSNRRSRAEERRHRRQQNMHQQTTGGTEELQDYFDQRWEETPPQ